MLLFIVDLEKLKQVKPKKQGKFYLNVKIKIKSKKVFHIGFFLPFKIISLSLFSYVPSVKTYDYNMSVHRPVSAQRNGLCYGAFFHKK